MLLLCLTGLPLIFHHEIDHMLGHSIDPPAVPDTRQEANLDSIIAEARQRNPDQALQFLIRDPEDPEFWFVRFGNTITSPDASAFYTYDARTGDFLSAYPLDEGVMNIIFRLHYDMFAGLPGILFLGFMGLLLVLSLVSGTILYGPFMRKLQFGTVRKHRSSALKWLDLHNLLGIATLSWLFVVGLTGVINTLAIPIFSHWQSTELAAMTSKYSDEDALDQTGSVQEVVNASRQAEPGKDISFMAFPGNDFASPLHFIAYMQGKTPLTSTLLKPLLIDARTGEVIDSRELPWYVSLLLVSQPLHFGDYGGMPLKVLWAILDIIAIIVLASGIYLWLRQKNLPVELQLKLQGDTHIAQSIQMQRTGNIHE